MLAAAGAAVIWAVLSVLAKKLMEETSSLTYSLLYSGIATVVYTPVFIYFLSRYSLDPGASAIAALLVSGLANIGGFITYNSSVKKGELSTVIPLTRLTPIFTAVLGFMVLGEPLDIYTGIGIFLVTAGSYVVLAEKGDFLAPFRNFRDSWAPKSGVLSAVIFSIASVADRFATQQIPPELYTYFIYVFVTAGFAGYGFTLRDHELGKLKEALNADRRAYLFTGASAVLASYLIFYAFSRAPASKVIPVIQVQILVSELGGYVFFREEGIARKLLGSAVLIAGVALVAI